MILAGKDAPVVSCRSLISTTKITSGTEHAVQFSTAIHTPPTLAEEEKRLTTPVGTMAVCSKKNQKKDCSRLT
jgi:hypothetical protein